MERVQVWLLWSRGDRQTVLALELRHTLGATTVARELVRVEQSLKGIADQALQVPRTSDATLRALAEELLVLESAALRLLVACNACPVEYAAALKEALGESEYQKVRSDAATLAFNCSFSGARLREFLGHRELNLLGVLRRLIAACRGRRPGIVWPQRARMDEASPYDTVRDELQREWLSVADEMQGMSQYIALEALAYLPFDLEYAEDLYQEASYGLRRAIAKYNPLAGGHFRSFASMYAYRFALRAAIDLPHAIAIPAHLHAGLVAVMRIGVDAKAEAVRAVARCDESDLRNQARGALAMALAVQPILGGAQFELLGPRELVQVQYAVGGGAHRLVEVFRLERHLCDALAKVGDRNRRIFLDYVTNDETTLEELGTRHHLTRERTRQIINKVREHVLQRLPASNEYLADASAHWTLRLADRWAPAVDANLARYEGRALSPAEVAKRRYICRRLAAQVRDWQLADKQEPASHVYVNEQILAFLKGGK